MKREEENDVTKRYDNRARTHRPNDLLHTIIIVSCGEDEAFGEERLSKGSSLVSFELGGEEGCETTCEKKK